MSKRPHDSQRNKLYAAEHVLIDISKPLPKMDDVANYVCKVMNRAPIKKRYDMYAKSGGQIAIKDGRRRQRGGGGAWGITMPRFTRVEYYVLHELAHVLTERKYGLHQVAWHGREFCAIYLDLVRFMMGKEAGDRLKISFQAHGVKYKAKRVMSPEARAALKARGEILAFLYTDAGAQRAEAGLCP